ncbi:hypothetical protein [Staphylococcus xylosus]|uniref:hypothetical protein n=1 Tax=Staphylococcus xylosus TaxID=1288 RepID=UPI001AACDAFC|nr:hypothetical protein [Staphylococcus xylosus]MBO3073342.1 hypothetical protein [Staphylococcus xylosus]
MESINFQNWQLDFIDWEINLSDLIGVIVSVVAICISVKSLKQSEYSIVQANRPYVVVYREYIQVLDAVHELIVIKNFGKSGAIIDSITFSPEYKDRVNGFNKNLFRNINNTFIAPNQSITTVVSTNALNDDIQREGITKVQVSYYDLASKNKDKFIEIFKINEDLRKDLIFSKSIPDNKKSISEVFVFSFMELLRRGL